MFSGYVDTIDISPGNAHTPNLLHDVFAYHTAKAFASWFYIKITI